jgi:hypothetical protein
MPDTLTKSEVDSKSDPSVTKQYDNDTPKDKQIEQFYELADGKKIGLLNTYRDGIGKLHTSLAAQTFRAETDIHRRRRTIHGHCAS